MSDDLKAFWFFVVICVFLNLVFIYLWLRGIELF